MDTAGFASISQQRAAEINKTKHKTTQAELAASKRALLDRLEKQYGDKFKELRCANMGTLWREFVKGKSDAEAFMEIMYPQFPKQVQLAYVHMFERAVMGEIELDQRLLVDKDKEQCQWDPIKDIEDERLQGLVNVSKQRMDKLLLDDDDGNDDALKKKTKKDKKKKKINQQSVVDQLIA